jgi:hypothetical protein
VVAIAAVPVQPPGKLTGILVIPAQDTAEAVAALPVQVPAEAALVAFCTAVVPIAVAMSDPDACESTPAEPLRIPDIPVESPSVRAGVAPPEEDPTNPLAVATETAVTPLVPPEPFPIAVMIPLLFTVILVLV